MKRKTYSIYAMILVLFAMSVYSIFTVSTQSDYIEAAGKQTLYKLNVAYSRGMIYDCNMRPLVNDRTKTVAAVAPTIESIGYLSSNMGEEYRPMLASALENGKPFVLEVEDRIEFDGITIFNVPERYSENQLAPHLIGYTDSEGNGAAGIELAMNDVLKSHGEISLYYHVDALGRVIAGETPTVVDTVKESDTGVVLTLDANIQAAAQKAAEKLGKGAIVVTEVPDCEIRALASVPDYSPLAVNTAMKSEDSPLLNRAFSAYTPGSVFKLTVAAQQMEEGLGGLEYTCTGFIEVDGMPFACINETAHGELDLQSALEKSCNCYFINAVQMMSAQPTLGMAYNMGFGTSTEFGRGLLTESGNLPEAKELLNNRAMANFSFGQGNLTVTPVQVAGMLNSIVSGGEYTRPKVIAGTVNSQNSFIAVDSAVQNEKVRIMERTTANQLQTYMRSAVENGTAKSGKPDRAAAGAKTGTAQTGIYEGEDERNHFWYCGYISDDSGPRYCIIVLCESTVSDNGAAAAAFKEVADYIDAAVMS